jgi:hypothetical protein
MAREGGGAPRRPSLRLRGGGERDAAHDASPSQEAAQTLAGLSRGGARRDHPAAARAGPSATPANAFASLCVEAAQTSLEDAREGINSEALRHVARTLGRPSCGTFDLYCIAVAVKRQTGRPTADAEGALQQSDLASRHARWRKEIWERWEAEAAQARRREHGTAARADTSGRAPAQTLEQQAAQQAENQQLDQVSAPMRQPPGQPAIESARVRARSAATAQPAEQLHRSLPPPPPPSQVDDPYVPSQEEQ